MARSSRHPREVRERAVALVWETQSEYGSQWEAIMSIAQKVGVLAESLRRWVPQAEIDGGARAGMRSDDAQALRELRRENRELRRANEILKAAASFFARELDPRLPRSESLLHNIRNGSESSRSVEC
jgi:transposase